MANFNTWSDVLDYVGANPNGALVKQVNPGDFMDGVQPDAFGKYRMPDGRMLGAGDVEYVNIPGYFGKNTGLQLTPGADGSVTQSQIDLSGDANPLMLAALAAAAAATGGGALAGMGGAEGAAAAPGWVSGYDLAMGSDLAGMTGAGAAAGAAGAAGGANAITSALSSAKGILSNPLTQVGASLVNGYMGQKAADKAADAQKDAAEAAIAEQRRQYDQTRTDLSPWRDRGSLAANRMSVMMGLSGNSSDPNYGKGVRVAPSYVPGESMNALQRFMRPLNRG